MAGLINSLEKALLDHVFGKSTYTAPTNWFVGLSSTTPTDTGSNFTEPTGGAYARVSTAATDWNAAVEGDPTILDNLNAVTFPTATADWAAAASLTHFGLFTAATLGTPQMWGALTTARNILNGDTARFAGGTLDVKLGDPQDVF